MADFGDMDDFNDHAVQGKPIKAYKNGHFENPKVLFVQHHWSWDEFLFAGSQRLEMVPTASRVFNADGAEIDDIMCIEENDMLFFSTGRSFKTPSSGNEDAQSSTDDKMATVVGGYKVTTLLGRGGFGEVRLGVHQLTNDKVALKFILKSEMGSLGDVERTTTEIQCLTALNHPSIIKLLRVINEPNHVVLVIELLEGGDLFHYLKHLPGGGLPEEEGAALFSQILAGVGYAHNQHICHRDLKLENILLSNKNDISNVKIADFGLSDFYKPGAMMKTSCGSISYLAPEVFRGTSNAGPPLDVWSLGVILFAIVCGRLPFEGSDLLGTNRPRENVIRNRIMRCQFKVDDHLSPACVDLVTQMLQPDPNERATIPQIFSHPWIRGAGSSCLPTDFSYASLASRERGEGDDGNDEDLDFAITYTPAKVALPGSPSVLPSSTGGTTSDDDKLPSIVPRSPARVDSFNAGAAAAASSNIMTLTSSGTPTSGRTRPRVMDPLQHKMSTVKIESSKQSPRAAPVGMGALVPAGSASVGLGSTKTAAAPGSTASSPAGANFKRNPSSNASSSRGTRTRQGGTSEREKLHVERAPAHATVDSEKLPIAHQKTTRRRGSDHHGFEDSASLPESTGKGTHALALETLGNKKIHHGHEHYTAGD